MRKIRIRFWFLLIISISFILSPFFSASAQIDLCSTALCQFADPSQPECQIGGPCVMCPACAGGNPCLTFNCIGVTGSDAECQIGGTCAGCPQCAAIGPPPVVEICDNGIDDDGDMLTDCDDHADCDSDPACSSAASTGLFPLITCGNQGQPRCTLCHLFDTANRLITFIRNIAFIVGGLMIVVGGIMMLLGGSSPRLLSLAKKTITQVVIGLGVIMLSFIIISSILATFAPGAATEFNLRQGGFIIECNPTGITQAPAPPAGPGPPGPGGPGILVIPNQAPVNQNADWIVIPINQDFNNDGIVFNF